jgi:hypothetical protein
MSGLTWMKQSIIPDKRGTARSSAGSSGGERHELRVATVLHEAFARSDGTRDSSLRREAKYLVDTTGRPRKDLKRLKSTCKR